MYKEIINEFKKIKVKGCIIKQHGDIVLEYYKNDKVKDKQHKINSCTKSIVSALLGICLEKGIIESLDCTIDRYFSEYLQGEENEAKRNLTILQLLTMTEGFDWPEFGEWNCFAHMEYAKDMVAYVLGRNLIREPGVQMNYNSGASQLIGEIIAISTGMPLVEFAKKELFAPLGIKEFTWWERNGHALAGSGMKMHMADMMKFGELYLNGGVYQGRRILSEEWVHESFVPHYMTYDGIGAYGYHWWYTSVMSEGKKIDINFALGYCGQYIIVVPKLDMVIAIVSELKDTMAPMEIVKNALAKNA